MFEGIPRSQPKLTARERFAELGARGARATDQECGAPAPVAPPAGAGAPCSPPTRGERRQARAVASQLERRRARALQRDRDLKRWTDRWEAGGGDPAKRPPAFPSRVWGVGRAIVCSPAASKAAMRWMLRHEGGAVTARLHDAAFGGGRWDHSDVCARRMIAFVCCLYMLASFQVWGRGARGTLRLAPCVRGYPRSLWCALLAAPHSAKPIAPETLSQEHDGWLGYIPRGEAAGVIEAVQVPSDVAEAWECGPSGYTINRYWLATNTANKPALELDRDGAIEFQRGYEAAHYGPTRALRGRELRAARAIELAAVIGPPS